MMSKLFVFAQTYLTILVLTGYKIRVTQAVAAGQTCATNGALAANPENKTQYFFCMNKVVYIGTCSDGRVFDERVAQCVYSGNDIGTSVNCEGNDYATFPYPDDNSKYYYCLNGQATIVQCQTNYYYDSIARTCVQGSNNGGIGGGFFITCPIGMNAFLADPNGDCARYILCLNGQASYMTCPSGYFFQPTSGNCGPNIPDTCISGGPCSKEQIGMTREIANNCQLYQACDNTTLIWKTYKCYKNYYYSPNRKQCGPTQPGGCGDYNYYDQNLPGYDTSFPIYPGVPSIPENPTIVCATSLNGAFADTSNCRKYYRCIDGTPYSMICPSGFYWNPLTRGCGPDIPSGCTWQNTDINIDVSPCPANSEVTMADPSNCKQYIVCTNGVGTSYACGPGLYYNVEENTCSSTVPNRCI